MIKSAKVSLKFANPGKLELLRKFIVEYRRVVSQFVDMFWGLEKVPKFINKHWYSKIDSLLSATVLQRAATQASEIVRSVTSKQSKREWKLKQLRSGGKFKQARKLTRVIQEASVTKPKIGVVNPNLTGQFISKLDLDCDTTFDGWLPLRCLGQKLKLILPFRKHKHFIKLQAIGTLRKGFQLSENFITFFFDIPEPIPKSSGTTLGIDIGQTTTLSCSNGQVVNEDSHGHSFQTISEKIARKKKGSKSFQRAQTHRTNYIGWCVNQLNLTGVSKVNHEDIKGMRNGQRRSKYSNAWVYRELLDKLDSKLEGAGVLLQKVCPTYTSQRCSSCGWVRKSNRRGKSFKCTSCGFTADADLNASQNIALELVPLSTMQRLKQENRIGFYWNVDSQELAVPGANKVSGFR